MGVYRIPIIRDNWISNKITKNVATTRITGSNFGSSPLLRVFKLTGTLPSSTVELARTLIQFGLGELSSSIYVDRTIPSSSVSYIFKMFNYRHSEQTPTSYDLKVFPLSRSWNEGNGQDDIGFKDWGFSNWLSASSTQTWTTSGSDFLTTYSTASQNFDRGDEDLEVDITPIVNNWITSSIGLAGGIPNNGLLVMLSSANEENSSEYKTKIFHGRETKDIDKVPYIEARWSDFKVDNRNNFAYNQSNTLYMYNFVRGELSSTLEPVTVTIKDSLLVGSASYSASVVATQYPPGVFSASFTIIATASFSSSWYDIWHSASTVYMTGTFKPQKISGSQVDQYSDFVIDVTNLKQTYQTNEQARIKVNVKKRNYKTHVIHSASTAMDREYVEKLYYSVLNDDTGEIIIPFGTGSLSHTRLSYNGDGNYFHMFFSGFIPGNVYALRFMIESNKDKTIIDTQTDYIFKIV